jgi:hypothetical protein
MLVRTALLAALCAALGYALAGVPNVELISAAVFTSGALVGPRRGALVGALAETVYAGFNPNGVSPPPLYAAQILGFALFGAAGGWLAPIVGRGPWLLRVLGAAAAGFALTLVFDVLTNAAVWVTVRESATLAAVVLGGLAFPLPLFHVLVNTVGFALLAPATLRAVERRSV